MCKEIERVEVIYYKWLYYHLLDIDECASNPCDNAGVCQDNVNGYDCNCAAGYTGVNCETSRPTYSKLLTLLNTIIVGKLAKVK